MRSSSAPPIWSGSFLVKPELQPDWVRDAYLIGPVRDGARRIEALLPGSLPAAPAARTGRPATDGEQGYTDAQRRALDKLVRRNLEVRSP